MARFWIDCFCWDLEDEGVDAALSRIKGDLYADDVCIQVQSDDVVMRRARDIGESRTIRMSAGAHFRPDASHYAATRIRPIASNWMKARDPFAKIAKACESVGVGLSVRASCLRNRALVEKHPMAACVDAFGDASRHRLCPSNPDVREYVVAMAGDLVDRPAMRRVELADVTFDSSRYARERALGFDLTGVSANVQDWCFCPACRQRAADHGCDTEAAQAEIRKWLNLAYERGAAGAMDDANARITAALGDDADLRAFQDARRGSERSLIAAVHARLGDALVLPVNDEAELAAIGPVARELGIMVRARFARERSKFPIPGVVAAVGDSERVAVRFDAYPPYAEGGPALVAAVHDTASAGHTEIGFYADGLLPKPCLDWIRQAIRYARREA